MGFSFTTRKYNPHNQESEIFKEVFSFKSEQKQLIVTRPYSRLVGYLSGDTDCRTGQTDQRLLICPDVLVTETDRVLTSRPPGNRREKKMFA